MPDVVGTIEEVRDASLRLVARRERAVLALGITPRGSGPRLEQMIREGLPPGATIEGMHVTSGDLRPLELARLNRSRDLLLRHRRFVLLTVPDEATLRAVRGATIDLTSTLDLSFEVLEAAAVDVETLLSHLIARAREGTAIVDLGALMPSDIAAAKIPVEALYLDLVPLQSAARGDPERALHLRRLLVLGQPGAGKTTFLRMLAHEYTASPPVDRLAVGVRVPVYVPLPAYARAREDRHATLSLVAFLNDWLVSEGIPGPISIRPLANRLLFLFDGLDEVRGGALRRTVFDEVQALAADAGAAVVVAGRTLVLDDLTAEPLRAFATRTLRAPAPEEVRLFLGRFLRARGKDRWEDEAQRAADRILGDRKLAELARTPLMLVFLALLHDLEGRIPDRRFLLYNRIAEILLDKWERARSRAWGSGAPARSMALGDTRRVVGTLAWWMIATGREDIAAPELRAELARIERERGATAAQAEARAEGLADALGGGSAVLVAMGGRWRFVHATLSEYFAGVEVARGGARWRQVLGDIFRPDWSEIVVFAVGELGTRADDERLGELAEALLARHPRGGRYGAAHASLLGAVLREDPGFSPPVARRLVERFVDLCFVPKYWPRSRPAVGEALRETASVALSRTWGSGFAETLGTVTDRLAWRDDHGGVASVVVAARTDVGLDSDAVVRRLTASDAFGPACAGWRERYAAARPAHRDVILAEARRALPGFDELPGEGERALRFAFEVDLATFQWIVSESPGPRPTQRRGDEQGR